MNNSQIKEMYSSIDGMFDKHFTQMVKYIKTSVVFGFSVCISFIFGSIPVKLIDYEFIEIIFKTKLGILIPWLIIGVLYFLQSRSIYNIYMELKSLGDTERAETDELDYIKKLRVYILRKFRNHPSVFNPCSNDYIGIVLSSAPLFLISCLTYFIMISEFAEQMFAKMAMMHPEEIGFLDFIRFYWETETFWDLTLYISLPVFYLAYFLFQFFLFCLVWYTNNLKSVENKASLKYERISMTVLFITAIVAFIGGPLSGSILVPILIMIKVWSS